MSSILTTYLLKRAEGSPFLLTPDLGRTITDLFPDPDSILPRPYKIFYKDETQPPQLGFPVTTSPPLVELESRLDRWLADEVLWQIRKENKERTQQSFISYLSHLIKLAENAMVSNLLADYHGVFWLAHSVDLARHFSALPRRIGAVDAQAGKNQGDILKYRIFSKWASESREQMGRMANRQAGALDGEQERGLRFVRLLQDNVLILTEEFVGPDLRELRSFVFGYLHRDFQQFREKIDRLRNLTAELIKNDRVVRATVELFGGNPDQALAIGLLTDRSFQKFLFSHPTIENLLTREEVEQFQSLSRRLNEFSVLHLLRRGLTWMVVTPEEEIIPADARSGTAFARTTRPIDFGRAGVVDPMVHRFGLMYDITSFSETLGNLARAGRKGELGSYRQMLLFQRKVEAIAGRHGLQFEKFLGDGAFYTTRRATYLLRAAVELQRFYAEMKSTGFAFDKGIRMALNYGYYRLLPMKGTGGSNERFMEFYGPGVVELSRLTTGKASKEIEEIQGFLVSHGYEVGKVHQFFAPLARGVDLVDHRMHQRPFYAYVNSSGHLVNEGIVASLPLIQELSSEIANEGQELYSLRASWGRCIGFAPSIEGVEYIGIRLIGTASLKGLAQLEVGEVVPFSHGEVEATPLDESEPLVQMLRQEYHYREVEQSAGPAATTRESRIENEIVLCASTDDDDADVIIGEWNPSSDEVRHSIRISQDEFRSILGPDATLCTATLENQKASLRELYRLQNHKEDLLTVQLTQFRSKLSYETYLLGDTVELLE